MFGQSFGACIVVDFAMRFDIPIAGLILSSTMLKVHSIENTSYGRFKIMGIKFFGEFFKDFVVNNLDNPTSLTKNCYNIKKHLDDRINVPFFGIRFLRELLFCSESVYKNASRYEPLNTQDCCACMHAAWTQGRYCLALGRQIAL